MSIGFGPEVRANFYEPRFEQQVTSIAVFGAALLVAGLLALFVWRGEGRDSVLFWYGLTALAAAFSAYLLLWPPKIEQETIGMHIVIDSQPAQGTRVTLKLPTTKDASRAAVDPSLELAHSGSPHFPGATRNRRVS